MPRTCLSNICVLQTCVSLLPSMRSKRGSACHGNRHQKPLLKALQQTIRMPLPRIQSQPILGPSTSDILPKHSGRSHLRALNRWVPWRTCANGMNNSVRVRERNAVYKSGGRASSGLWTLYSVEGKMKAVLRSPAQWHGERCQ